MKTKLLGLFICIITYSCAANNSKNNILLFENFEVSPSKTHLNIYKYNRNVINCKKANVFDVDMQLNQPPIEINKDDSLFHFLCQQDIVSRWCFFKNVPDSILLTETTPTREKAKEKKIRFRESKISMMLILGEIIISNKFRSLLIQTTVSVDQQFPKDDIVNGLIEKNLYMLNFRNNSLVSIIMLSMYFSSQDEEIHSRTKKDKGNNYLYIEDSFYSTATKFKITSKGKIILR